MSHLLRTVLRPTAWVLPCAALLMPIFASQPAHAWWVRSGGPVVVVEAPPVVVAPPVAVAPAPPVVVAPAPPPYARWVPAHYDRWGRWIPGHWT